MAENEILTVIYRRFDKQIRDEDRLHIQYIINSLVARQFSPRVFNMVFNYVLLMFEGSDYENIILSFNLLFEDILIDAFDPDARKYHLSKIKELK